MPYKWDDKAASVTFADSADLFENIDPAPATNCQVQTCTVMDKDCQAPSTYPGLTMTATAPFSISRDSLQVHGFDYVVCIKCNNGQMSTTSSFRIGAESKCLPSYKTLHKVPLALTDEQKALPEEEQPTENAFKYESSFSSDLENAALNMTDVGFNGEEHAKSASYEHNKTYEFYFANDDWTNCKYDQCELMAEGCEWPYTATPHLKMGADFPWTITAFTNVTNGYNTTYCVKCSNAWDSITQDQLVFTQHQATPWFTISIIVIAVVIVLSAAAAGAIGWSKGKATASALV